MIGKTLSQFRITDKLGEGGMGAVYRAEDTKLGREVAIKVLPEAFVADPERLARFEREARVLASLNHPRIAALHEVGEASAEDESGRSFHFLVMELAPGEDLTERIARGALPPEQALAIAVQIAEAIGAAHEKGVIHRDLKPANVKVTEKGEVKVLDFGLAKAWEPQSVSGSGPLMSHSPTLTAQMTQMGTLLGTAAYMSPEQARGKEVDKRADIWAFGCLVVEMLTGEATFAGETVTDVFASIVTREPGWEKLPARIPNAVRRVLERCLEKDVDRRLHDIADARIELEEALAAGLPEGAERPAPEAVPGRLRLWQGIAVALALAVLALGGLLLRPPPAPATATRATLLAPEGTKFDLDWGNPGLVAVSPDGRSLAFSAVDEGNETRLYVRDLEDLEARPIAGTEGAAYPFWSPDGRFVAFFDSTKLKKVEVSGGPAITLCNASNGKGGTWGPDGTIVFAPSHDSALFRVAASGGEAVPITEVDRARFNGHRFPEFLPDGEHFLFLARSGTTGAAESQVMVGDLRGQSPRELLRAASAASYAAGHLFFLVERTLMARPFDAGRLELTGEMFPVAENVIFGLGAARAAFSVSEGGTMAYHAGAVSEGSTLQWLGRDGAPGESPIGRDGYTQLRLASGGSRAAVSIVAEESANEDLWILDLERGLKDRFTFEEAVDHFPVWSPDGERIAFTSSRDGRARIYVKSVLSGEEEALLFEDEVDSYVTDWSPDGRYLTLVQSGTGTSWDSYLLDLEEGGDLVPLQPSQFVEAMFRFSPDGRWFAYGSTASGRSEIYVTFAPQGGRKWQVSAEGGNWPVWDSSGKALYWLSGQRLMGAEVDGSGEIFRVGKVFEIASSMEVDTASPNQYDLVSDGSRFLVNIQEDTSVPPLTLVLDFPAELGVER